MPSPRMPSLIYNNMQGASGVQRIPVPSTEHLHGTTEGAPLDDITPHILRLWKARQIIQELQKHIDTTHYGIGLTTLLKVRKTMGLQRTRQQGHTVETIRNAMIDLHTTYPNAGAREIHNKWLQFGLGLHTGIEPFSGRIMWIQVWHSNRNPQLILSYYLDTIEALGHMLMVTQSDPGSENYGIANAHTMLRQWYDAALHDYGVNSGWYDSNNTLQVMVFCWVFIPWLQQELNAYQDRVNNTAKRRDRNKILPHGVPNLIYHSAEDFGALDFKIKIEHEALDHVRSLYIKSSHSVFDLVPEAFGKCIQHCYDDLSCPAVTQQSAWDIYQLLLDALWVADALPNQIQLLGKNYEDLPSHEEANGAYYMGGVGGGLGLDTEHLHQLDIL
ncbi:uncharacterized protein EDB93DRAFT_1284042 [Suillus bovinus]|uniref:uncharacterized protein n=1 Tax=Suillus bovinus TaxID=48563 RepID=UPI001B86806B|nr:uncharacterized protein EDB93DRAFT_1284042 [Suillus bovinus]KAG2159142.1 hypothetical protein EDB93DRAFT_1284042 [Suillus bovinus]